MAANYVLLEKITVGAAGASSVTFSGIPQTGYTDLVLRASVRSSNATTQDDMYLRFNGDTGSNYSDRAIYSNNGTSAASLSHSSIGFLFTGSIDGTTSTASTFTSTDFYIPNYASANYKSVLQDIVNENNATAGWLGMFGGLWASSSAITSITLSNSPFAQYSTFYLYGVAKYGTTPAIVPYATGGDTIMTDGTYWYHTFVSSGTFTPQKGITCDYLVVAGGGGGSGMWYYELGGGGAGGLRSTVTATGGGGSLESALSLASGTGYTVTIGAGGAGAPGPLGGTVAQHTGTVGSNSVFSTITSTGGGGGAGSDGTPSSGGSGGGGGGTGASGIANQGYAGGNSAGGSGYSTGGGGGGAGAVGGNGSNPNAGNGGNGVATSISGSSVTYGGGGGGGTYDSANVGSGGTGGGGNANNAAAGSAGTANRGGGGGAGVRNAGTQYVGGAGGSGIVVVRYAV